MDAIFSFVIVTCTVVVSGGDAVAFVVLLLVVL